MKDNLDREEVLALLRCKPKSNTFHNYLKLGVLPEPKEIDGEKYFSRRTILKMLGVSEDLNEPFITPEEAAEILGISNKTDVAAYAKRTGIPFYKLVNKKGAQCLYLKSEIEAAMKLELQWQYADFNKALQTFSLNFLKTIISSDFIKHLSERDQEVLREIIIEGKSLTAIASEVDKSGQAIAHRFEKACINFMESFNDISNNISESKSVSVIQKRIGVADLRKKDLEIAGLKELHELSSKLLENATNDKEALINELYNNNPFEDFATKYDLSKRTENFCKKVNVSSPRQLSLLRKNFVYKFRDIGKKTINEMEYILKENGLNWAE